MKQGDVGRLGFNRDLYVSGLPDLKNTHGLPFLIKHT